MAFSCLIPKGAFPGNRLPQLIGEFPTHSGLATSLPLLTEAYSLPLSMPGLARLGHAKAHQLEWMRRRAPKYWTHHHRSYQHLPYRRPAKSRTSYAARALATVLAAMGLPQFRSRALEVGIAG